ncbi:MAG: hypothetical protein KGZ94_08440 [Clostridia bacterium]|nr:hypothetical protein [Clostridia bacterium]
MKKKFILICLVIIAFVVSLPILSANITEKNFNLQTELQKNGLQALEIVDITETKVDINDKEIFHTALMGRSEFEQIRTSKSTEESFTVIVETIGSDITYAYREATDEAPVLYILPGNAETDKPIMKTHEHECEGCQDKSNIGINALPGCNGPCSKDTEIPGGLGTRLPMPRTGSGGNLLTYTVTTSSTSQTLNPLGPGDINIQGACYLYGGFSGRTVGNSNVESDLGFIYQSLAGTSIMAWKPFFRLSVAGVSDWGSPVAPYNQVYNKNGYIPGQDVGVEIARNHNNTGRVRLRTEGLAYHADYLGNGGNTWLIHIIQSEPLTGNNAINTISTFKLIAHPAHPNSGQYANDSSIIKTRVHGNYKNIRIDGSVPAFSNTQKDYGYATKDGTNSYTLGVCKGF